jgi:hypothetical protein
MLRFTAYRKPDTRAGRNKVNPKMDGTVLFPGSSYDRRALGRQSRGMPSGMGLSPQFSGRIDRQGNFALLDLRVNLMSSLQRVCKTLGILGLVLALPAAVFAQSGSGYVTNGTEFAPAGALPGDQIDAAVSLNASGGYLVWADNITDGSGYGISAVRLDSTFSPAFSPFRINLQGADDQERPQASLLNGGGVVIVWQGGKQSFQHIYAAFLSSSNTFVARDVPVNVAANYQDDSAVATLTNGNVIITWASRGQDNTDGLQGVYARLFTPTGTNIGGEFMVNQFTPWNQRTPAVAALANGSFVVAWVSERENSMQIVDGAGNANTGRDSVDVYARLYNSAGAPLGNEFLVNTSTNVCANPNIAGASDGTFILVWGEKDAVNRNNSWDVYSRRFSSAGAGGAVQRVNTQRYGDQFAPRITASGTDYMVVWTSMGQDGSREGVFGQFLHGDGSMAGGEFRVNTTVLNQQMFPAVASDGRGRFLVVWSSYAGGVNSLDLNSQRYATYLAPLSPPAPPIVTALDAFALSVTWPPLAGFEVDHWAIYVDTNGTPVLTTNNYWQNESLSDYSGIYDYNPGSTHSFQLAYVLADGRESPLSATATGKTWGNDRNNDGLPDDWQTLYWGTNRANWPTANTLLAPGVTALMVFEQGANPLDPNTWLKTSIANSPEGWFLSWNTVVGGIYQVQSSSDLRAWSNLGSPRFAAGTTDSVYLGLSNNGYYRITRLLY